MDYFSEILAVKMNAAAMFAEGVHRMWQIDQCEDGILIFYSAEDHVVIFCSFKF